MAAKGGAHFPSSSHSEGNDFVNGVTGEHCNMLGTVFL